MLTSMTGFGRAVCDAPFGKVTVEIQSVNRKYFELFISLPKEFSRFEHELRKIVCESVGRGQVTFKLFFTPDGAAAAGLLPNVEVLKALKDAWETICKELHFDPKQIDFPFLVNHLPPHSEQSMIREEDFLSIRPCIDEAVQSFLMMKNIEGRVLTEDVKGRLQSLVRMIDEVQLLTPNATEKMRHKLFEKMAELFHSGGEVEERLLREVALFAEKVDISEEITRFKSHIAQFEQILEAKGTAVGRKMDFLIQELGREINTIGSKSMEAKISHLVVDLKSELEKMREQIQNVE